MMHLVSLAQVDHVWPKVQPWVEQAIVKARSLRKAVELYSMCRNGALFLAVATPSIGAQSSDEICGVDIFHVEQDGDNRILQHLVVAADPANSETLNRRWIDEMIRWPKFNELGITRVVAEGRAGWPDFMKDIVPTLKVVRVVMEWRQADVLDGYGPFPTVTDIGVTHNA